MISRTSRCAGYWAWVRVWRTQVAKSGLVTWTAETLTCRSSPRRGEGGGGFAGVQEHPGADGQNAAGVLGHGDELGRLDVADLWAGPAQKGLDGDGLAGGKSDDRLVDQAHLAAGLRAAQGPGDLDSSAGLDGFADLGEDAAVLARSLRLVHCLVGSAQGLLGVDVIASDQGDTDAGGHRHRGQAGQRLRDDLQQPGAEPARLVGVLNPFGDHDELVPAEPADEVVAAQCLGQPPRLGAQASRRPRRDQGCHSSP